ncbi:hypothetical protein T11_12210 [Trichinella zimbabwensis]|uniref:Uncharacterized protein n=1 Tax=Trichinella zimbabwensis TaxID=268475 RepID=A0A0V1I916_9BILA|nr:hypothetical protein T11_12210 [Trichinella zimbabwensis]
MSFKRSSCGLIIQQKKWSEQSLEIAWALVSHDGTVVAERYCRSAGPVPTWRTEVDFHFGEWFHQCSAAKWSLTRLVVLVRIAAFEQHFGENEHVPPACTFTPKAFQSSGADDSPTIH